MHHTHPAGRIEPRPAWVRPLLVAGILLSLFALAACKKKPDDASTEQGPVEHIDAEQKAAASKLQPAKDPVDEEIYAYRIEVRQAYNNRRFDDLEAQAKELRASKPLFGNGSWKIVQFYAAFECRDEEPDSMWELHDRIHKDWIAAKPTSITAHVAYAGFQIDYAWKARGTTYADKVTSEGWALFEHRLAAAHDVLVKARALPEKDPVWWLKALRVALGAGMSKAQYDQLLAEAVAFEPKFWGYDNARAYSLLPRWYGQEGDWEAYAAHAAARPDGLGPESYARIVISLRAYYDNVFRDTKATWPQTREGLERMRAKYPDSLDILSESALLATMAEDRALARELFERLGDRYLASVWRKPERFAHYRHWAETGQW